MILLSSVLVLLHIAAAAAWFGMALRLPTQSRLVEAMGGPSAREVGAATRKGIDRMGIYLMLSFVFGLVAFFIRGGFGRYGAEFHTSLLLMVLLLALHYALIRPGWNRFTEAVALDNSADASRLRKRLGAHLGIGHLLWLTLLFLMLWERYFAGLLVV